MCNNFYVYVFVRNDTNQVFYVGKGKGNRYKDMSMRNKYFVHIVQKVGKENIKSKIIEDGLCEELAFEREKYYIKYFKSIGHVLTNMTDGGEGTSGWFDKLTEEEKTKHREVSKSFLGKRHTPETRLKMSKSAVGRIMKDSTKKLISEKAKGRTGFWKGKHLSEETRRKLSESKKGKPSPTKGKKKIGGNYKTTKVIVFDGEGNKYKEFDSCKLCYDYFSKLERPLKRDCIKSHIRSKKPLSDRYTRYKEYVGLTFVRKRDLEPQSTIESIDDKKSVVE